VFKNYVPYVPMCFKKKRRKFLQLTPFFYPPNELNSN
jgi:hypothetical protein